MSNLMSANAVVPNYDRNKIQPKIVHLGFGAFHRAHQAVFADILASEHNSDWGYTEVNIIDGEQQIRDLPKQDNLFSVTEISPKGMQSRVVGVVKNALHANIDGIEKVIAAMCSPDVAIVSLTVTEKAYCYEPATGKLMLDHPLIIQDIANPQTPTSVPGVIVEALRIRRNKNLKSFSVLSCDNMPENGHVTRNVVLQYANMIDNDLAQWIEKNVTFPSTMVDRIVPAITPEVLSQIEQHIGVKDPVAIGCEPFIQWVIEDNFVNGRPNWEQVGVELVKDVLPFEEMKLRMLNGSHSFLAYLARLAGHKLINDSVADEVFYKATKKLMLSQQAPTLKVQGVDLNKYANLLLERFANPALGHKTEQIASDGSQKLPQRILDSIRFHIAHGNNFDLLALAVAGWMKYVQGKDDKGEPVMVNDPAMIDIIKEKISCARNGAELVEYLLSITAIFGTDLSMDKAFKDKITEMYLELQNNGSRSTVSKYA